MLKHIVNVDWLKEHLNAEDIRIIDCRFQLGMPNEGFEAYVKGHIPGAMYFDLEKDLSSKVQEHGGRHPLPDFERLSDKLSTAGIDSDTKVIVYDDQEGMMASRFWWTLKYLGHNYVYVLEGGFSNWKNSGGPISDDIPHFGRKEFVVNFQPELLAGVEEVKSKKSQENVTLIDSRVKGRFLGINETVDKKAGHIPDAVNYFWKDVLTEDGKWKTINELKDHFNEIDRSNEIIVYCGSGVSACPNILALSELGYDNVKLYVGSWSDWITYPENEVVSVKE